MSSLPRCRPISVYVVRADDRRFASYFRKAIRDEKYRGGPRPDRNDCLFYTGHIGVSIDGGSSIYGFTPEDGGIPVWELMMRLKIGEAFPGIVVDDTQVFAAASIRGISVREFDVILPEPRFQIFEAALDSERRKSQFQYEFPNGDGDCNCATWIERLGLPLLTGRMDELMALSGISNLPSRRFGACI